MTPAEQARLLLRKAAQDQAVLERLIDDPLIEATTLTPFATVYHYDDLPAEEVPDLSEWPQLLRSLELPPP